MHELSIAEGIIEIVERTANANHVRHVKTVRVSIGELAGVDIPSLEFAWQSVRKGGVAQNAELEIERPNGEAWCLQCQKNIPLHRYGDPCPDCGGRGYVVTQQRTPFGVMQSQQPCSHCGGRGTIIRNPCKTCRGTGKTAARKSLEINIPAGIDDDQNIALRGQGDAGSNGGPAGDVIVHVTVKADPMFERDGYDVTIHVPITFSQAVLGDDVEVPTVDGRIVQHIPEGTQSGTKFRLRGQGIQYLNGRGRGDQYVIVDVEIPKKVTRAQREALKAFEDSMKEDNYEKRKGFFKNLRDRFS